MSLDLAYRPRYSQKNWSLYPWFHPGPSKTQAARPLGWLVAVRLLGGEWHEAGYCGWKLDILHYCMEIQWETCATVYTDVARHDESTRRVALGTCYPSNALMRRGVDVGA